MQFRDIKPGYTLYAFNRADVQFKQLKVLSVTSPHYDSNFPGATISDMVVDITIEGEQKPYTFKERSESSIVGNLIISTSIETALGDVEALMAQSQQALSQREKLESNIEKCKTILSENSPKYKEKQETEKRFVTIENSIGRIEEFMNKQQDMMEKLYKELKG